MSASTSPDARCHAPPHQSPFSPRFPTGQPIRPRVCTPPSIAFWHFRPESTVSTKCSQITSSRRTIPLCISYEITIFAASLPNSNCCTPPAQGKRPPFRRSSRGTPRVAYLAGATRPIADRLRRGGCQHAQPSQRERARPVTEWTIGPASRLQLRLSPLPHHHRRFVHFRSEHCPLSTDSPTGVLSTLVAGTVRYGWKEPRNRITYSDVTDHLVHPRFQLQNHPTCTLPSNAFSCTRVRHPERRGDSRAL